jgi:hypothetical protein
VVEVEDGRIADVAPSQSITCASSRSRSIVSRCADLAAIRRRLARELDEAAEEAARPVVAAAVLRCRLASSLARDRLRLQAELLSALRADAAALTGTAAGAARRAPDGGRACAISPHRRAPRRRCRGMRRIRRARRSAERAAAGQPIPGPDIRPLLRQWDAETDLAAQRELVRDATAGARRARPRRGQNPLDAATRRRERQTRRTARLGARAGSPCCWRPTAMPRHAC